MCTSRGNDSRCRGTAPGYRAFVVSPGPPEPCNPPESSMSRRLRPSAGTVHFGSAQRLPLFAGPDPPSDALAFDQGFVGKQHAALFEGPDDLAGRIRVLRG